MSLSSALNTAQLALSNHAQQTSVLSKNISNASNPDYNRREAVLSSNLHGASILTTQRQQDKSLLRATLQGTAAYSSQKTLSVGLEQLKSIFGGNDYETSPATLLTTLRDSLSTLAVKPSDPSLAQVAIVDAVKLAQILNSASAQIQQVRLDADKQIAADVDQLNDLLAQFKAANDAVVNGSEIGKDVNNELDTRDTLLKRIAEIIPVSTVTRTGNDIAIYTTDGLTVFEKVPRPVTFQAIGGYSANTSGNAVYIDGAPIGGGVGASTTGGGSIQAQLQLRDDYAPQLQSQLDEIARGLIAAFAESDQSATPTLPDMPGLFTWPGGTVPAAGTLVPGISASITVNPIVLNAISGGTELLRDGGINGAAYVYNPAGDASYSDRLDALAQSLGQPIAFDSGAGLGNSASLVSYSTTMISMLEQNRSVAADAIDTKEAFLTRSEHALSNATGVSIDEEMSLLLELEQSYKASAKIIAAVDEMLQALMAAA